MSYGYNIQVPFSLQDLSLAVQCVALEILMIASRPSAEPLKLAQTWSISGWFLRTSCSQHKDPSKQDRGPCPPHYPSQIPHIFPLQVVHKKTKQLSIHHDVVNDLLYYTVSGGTHLQRDKSCHQIVIKKESQALIMPLKECERRSNS